MSGKEGGQNSVVHIEDIIDKTGVQGRRSETGSGVLVEG